MLFERGIKRKRTRRLLLTDSFKIANQFLQLPFSAFEAVTDWLQEFARSLKDLIEALREGSERLNR